MTIETHAFQTRLRTLLTLQGTELSDIELAHLADRYPHCTGKERWDVRQYVGHAGVGSREFRVMRGTRTDEVYCTPELAQATGVGAALNALELTASS